LVHGKLLERELHFRCEIPGCGGVGSRLGKPEKIDGRCLALARLPYTVYTLGVSKIGTLTHVKRKRQTCSDVRAQSRESRGMRDCLVAERIKKRPCKLHGRFFWYRFQGSGCRDQGTRLWRNACSLNLEP